MGTPLTRGEREASPPTGWCYKAPPSPKEGPGRTSNEAPAAPLVVAVVARRGSGSVMRFPAAEAPEAQPGRKTASSAVSRAAHPAMISLATLAILIAIFALEVAWVAAQEVSAVGHADSGVLGSNGPSRTAISTGSIKSRMAIGLPSNL